MRGANGSTAGARGLVPRPAAADNVKYLKGDGSWSAVTNASAATNAEAAAATSTTTFVTPANAAMAVAAVRNGLAPRQGLVFDGTTSATVANLHILGTGDFTATAVIKPTSVAVGEQSLFGGSIGTFTLSIGRSIAGSLSALKVNVALAGEVSAGLVAGKWSTVTYTRSGTTGTFYVNGAAVGSTITDSQNYTVAQDG